MHQFLHFKVKVIALESSRKSSAILKLVVLFNFITSWKMQISI
jgi:hypothetical protein